MDGTCCNELLGRVGIPRIDPPLLYLIAAGCLWALMPISFVAVPARIIGVKKRRLKPKEAVGHWTAGGALSAVAMTPASSSTASA